MIIREGEKFRINEGMCNDLDLLEWYDKRENKVLVAQHVEEDTNGVWVKDCPYRIDFSEIMI